MFNINCPGTDYDLSMSVAERRAFADSQVFVTVMFETGAALADLDAIAAMDGIDGLTLGPSDLAQDLGIAGHPEMATLLDEKRDLVLAAARKHGKACAMLCATEAQAKQWVQAGVEIIAYSSDSEVMARAYAGSMKAIRG